MCGRYTLSDTGQLLEEVLDETHVEFSPEGEDGAISARFNIAPTQQVPAIREEEDGVRRLAHFRWGLVPFWADDLKIGNRMINARSETAATKPSFRNAYKRRRCLILTDGFYEWKKLDGAKQPFHIHRPGRRPFTFAGLWERWSKGEEPVESCTILTTSANPTVRDVHDRMPVILDGAARDFWLDNKSDPQALTEIMKPYEGELELTPVSKLVNNPRHDTPRCLDAVQL